MTKPAATAASVSADVLAPPMARHPSMHLHDPVSVPLLTDVLAARDVEAAWSGLRKCWGDLAPVDLGDGARAWLVTGYQAIVALARDPHAVTTNASTWNEALHHQLPELLRTFGFQAGQPVETVSGSEHARLRAPLEEVLETIEASDASRVTQQICNELVGRLGDRLHADPDAQLDLMREYVEPTTRLVFGTVIGLDREVGRQAFELADDLAASASDPLSLDELSFLLGGRVMHDADRTTPIRLLAQHPGYRDSRETVLGLLSLVAGAAAGLKSWLGQVLLTALADPQFARRLAGGRLGADEAIEQVLWDASPSTTLAPRFALQEGHLLGEATWTRRGDAILLAVGAAASDPTVRGQGLWDGLGNRAHLAWGAGAHRCPAPGWTRLIVRTAVETLLRHTEPHLAVDIAQIRWAPGLRFRRPDTLPVTFTP